MTQPTEFTIVSAKNGGWIVYKDSTQGRPDYAGTLDSCCNYVRQQAGEDIGLHPDPSAYRPKFPIPQRD